MLTKGAANLVQLFELQTGTLPDSVVQKLESSEKTDPTKHYDAAAVEQLLIQALPDSCDLIKRIAKDACRAQNDGKGSEECGVSILEARIRTLDKVAQAPRPPPPVRVDPYEVVFKMPKETSFVMFFNARKVDPEGRPAVMGIAAREGCDVAKLDQSYFYVPDDHVVQSQSIKKNAEFARFKEENDHEFRAGDPIVAVALDAKGNFISSETLVRPLNEHITEVYPGKVEGGQWVADLGQPMLNRSVAVGEALDQTQVSQNDKRILLELRMPPGYSPPGFWMEKIDKDLSATVMLKRGFIFEPGARAKLTLAGTVVETKVEGKDADVVALPVRLPGSPTKAAPIPFQGSLQQALMQQATVEASSDPQARDAQARHVHVEDLVMPYLKDATMAGISMGSLKNGTLVSDVRIQDASSAANAKLSVVRRPASEVVQKACNNSKAQTVQLDLHEGFVTLPGRDLAGFQIEVGYHDGKSWTKLERRKLGAGNESEKQSFRLDIPDPAALEKVGGRLEVRLYTPEPEGLPLKRTLIAFNQNLGWASDVFG